MRSRAVLAALFLSSVVLLGACAGTAIPAFKAPVVDDAGVLSSATEATVSAELENFRKSVGPQVAILVVNSTGDKSIEDYGIDVAREWAVGDKERDDGVLVVIAMEDRKLRIETGSGIEGDLTDLEAARVIDYVIAPQLRENKPDAAVQEGALALMTELSGESYVMPEVQPTGAQTTDATLSTGEAFVALFGFLLFLVFMIGSFIRSKQRGTAWVGWFLIGMLLNGGNSRGGGGGGFSGGGGGGFSGGGASGSW